MEITCPLCGYPGLLMGCEAGYCQVYHRISELCDFPEELLEPHILEEFRRRYHKVRVVEEEEEELEELEEYEPEEECNTIIESWCIEDW